MCVLCWQFLTETHWTEQPLAVGTNAASDTAPPPREHVRRRDWRQRTQVLNHILSAYGLHLDNWQNRSYVLSDRKGRTVMVQDLGALWPAAQRLLGRGLDPLDPQLLEKLEGAHQMRAGAL